MLPAEFNTVIEIVRVCVNANRADLIESALFDHKSVDEIRAKIESERAARPAARPAAASRSLAAIKKRFAKAV